jgi:FkbM family methyltransferase
MSSRISGLIDAVSNLGFFQTVHYAYQRLVTTPLARPGSISVRSKYAEFPLQCRVGTSDKDVFGQIFISREYRCLDHVRDASFILDCGANCGYSAAYFLTRYPQAELVAIEPDPGNFQVLEENLRPYGARGQALRTGVWSRETGLLVTDSPRGDGREWARSVREAQGAEKPDLYAVDIGTLIQRYARGRRVSILKIDIEGSEVEVFGSGRYDWLSLVDNMVIELHGPDCEQAVMSATRGQPFSVSTCDELTVFTRSS